MTISLKELLLTERDYKNIRMYANEIRDMLMKHKSKLANKSLSNDKVLQILNNELQSHNFPFEIVISEFPIYDKEPAMYIRPNEEIIDAFMTSSKLMKIRVSTEFNNAIKYQFNDVINAIHSIIVHELTHGNQFDKSKIKFRTANLNTQSSYLSNRQEIQAHANGAMQEYLNIGYSIEQIKKMLRSPSEENQSPDVREVDQFWGYYDYFYDPNEKNNIWKLFLKYCYQYLDDYE
jgi:hypothetical protein